MDSRLPTLDRNAYLASQARELLATTANRDSWHAVQTLRHVFAEADTAAGMWLASWYFDLIMSGSSDPALHTLVDECLAELENTYGW